MVKDGWKEVAKGTLVYVENGMAIRAIVGGRSGSVYKWDGKQHCYTNACPVNYETFRKGFRGDRYIVK